MLAIFSSACSPSVKIVYPFLNFLYKIASRKRPEFIEDDDDKFADQEIDYASFIFMRIWKNYNGDSQRLFILSTLEIVLV